MGREARSGAEPSLRAPRKRAGRLRALVLGAALLWACAPAPCAARSGEEQPARPAPERVRIRPRLRRAETSVSPLERAPIGRIVVQPGNVYDHDPDAPLASVRRLANRLHVRTRPATVRNELLFSTGEPWTAHAAEETARNLRGLDYLVPERIEARPEGDSVSVTVVTRDLWTTSPELNVETVGGTRTGSWGLAERNLFGFGKSVCFLYAQGSTAISRSLTYDDPNLSGSRVRLHLGFSRSVEGTGRSFDVGRPFYAEETPRSWDVAAQAATSVAHLYQDGREIASFDQRLEGFLLARGWRLPGDSTIVRLTGSFELLDRRYGPSRLAPGAPAEFAGGEENDRRRMLGADLLLWRPRYLELEEVDRWDRVEDFDVGPSVRLKAAVAPRALGSTVDEGLVQAQLACGLERALGFGWMRAGAESRLRRRPLDQYGYVEGRWYLVSARHTLVLAGLGQAEAHASRPWQLVVGGLNGLRAFPAQALAGRRLWRLNVEERWLATPREWDLLRAGTAVFYDAARAWGPGAAGTGWFQDAGFGVRLGFPQVGLAQVVRVDLAWPIEPTLGGRREAVLSIGSSQAF